MAENLETLMVKLDADIERFRRAMKDANKVSETATDKIMKAVKKAEGAIKKLGSSFKNAAKNMAAFGAASVAVAGIGLAAIFNKSRESIDQLAKLSIRLGIATESLGRMKHIAELAGIEFSTFGTAMQRFQRRTADAAQGNRTLSKAFSDLGVSAQSLLRLPAEERFYAISTALNRVQDSSERLRLAFQLFDTEGVAILQATNLGTQALRDMATEADLLGLSMGQDMVNAVERTNDSIYRLTALFRGVAEHITAAAAPAVEFLVDLFRNKLVESIQTSGGSVSDWSKAVVVSVLDTVSRISNGITQFALRTLLVIDNLYKFLDKDNAPLLALAKDIARIDDELNDLLEKTKQAAKTGVQIRGEVSISGTKGKPASVQVAENITETFKSIERAGLEAGESIRQGLLQVSLDVRRPIQSIADTIENTFINAANKIFSRVVGDILNNILSKTFGGLFGGFLGFAGGGRVGGPALVNERGTESLSSGKGLFVPIGGPATVVNAADTRRNMGGGQVVTQNFNIQTGLPDQIYTVVRNIAAQSGAEAAARMVRQSQGVI